MLSQLLNILAPLLICAAIGVIWRRSGHEYPAEFISRLVMNVAAPCLILHSLTSTDIELSALWDVALVAVIITLGTLILALPLLRACKFNYRTYLPPMLFTNCGNMALPLCLFAFGEAGLALSIGYFLAMMVMQLTLGILILAGTEQGLKNALINLFKQPMIHAMLLGLLLSFQGWTLPVWAARSVELIGGVTIPLMLITLGISLTGLQVTFWRRASLLSLFRLAIGLSLALLACYWLEISGLTLQVIVLQAAMPAAVFNYLFALRYQQQADEVAGLVVVSTAVSTLLLPLLLYLLLTP